MTTKGALAELAAIGVIVRKKGKGSFVADPVPDISRLGLKSSLQEDSSPLGGRLIRLVIPGFANAFGTKLVNSIAASLLCRGRRKDVDH